MTQVDSYTASLMVPLVAFSWGSGPTLVRYCGYDDDLVTTEGTFTSAPELEVGQLTLDGGTSDQPVEVTMRATRAPAATLVRPYPHAPVSAFVYELYPSHSTEPRLVYSGQVTRSVKNAAGLRGMAKLQVSGHRVRLTYALGIIGDTSCAWTFADNPGPANCGILHSAVSHACTVAAVSGRQVTVSGAPAGRYAFGSLERDGLAIDIVSASGLAFQLAREPPPEWLGQAATAVEGCDKKVATCRLWNNEHRFGGIGIGIPPYHPILEDPG